mgnify:CR=1 FL=1
MLAFHPLFNNFFGRSMRNYTRADEGEPSMFLSLLITPTLTNNYLMKIVLSYISGNQATSDWQPATERPKRKNWFWLLSCVQSPPPTIITGALTDNRIFPL